MSEFLVTNPFGVIILALIGMLIYDGFKKIVPVLFARDEQAELIQEVNRIDAAFTDYECNVHMIRMARYTLVIVAHLIMVAILLTTYYSSELKGDNIIVYGYPIGAPQRLAVTALMVFSVIRLSIAVRRTNKYSTLLLDRKKTKTLIKSLESKAVHLKYDQINFEPFFRRNQLIAIKRNGWGADQHEREVR